MDLGIHGRVALVLGASKGIGRAVAEELAREGARVAVSARSLEPLEELAAEIDGRAFAHDNADLDHIPQLIAAVTDSLGPIEILITNTGGPPANPDPLGAPISEWDAAYRTLVLAPVALLKAAVPSMCERGFGRIVNIASTTVREPLPALILSNSHRAATLAAFKTVARGVAGSGVTVNTVLPGRIATDRLFELHGGRATAEKRAVSEIATGRLGAPAEVAAAITFLCSARASYITGVALPVDGGLMASI